MAKKLMFQGQVAEEGSPVERMVRVFGRESGELVAYTMSTSGEFEISNYEDGTPISGTFESGEYLVENKVYQLAAFDDLQADPNYNALLVDRQLPTVVTL
jgi:hypothetical protein